MIGNSGVNQMTTAGFAQRAVEVCLSTKIDAFDAVVPSDILAIIGENGVGSRRFAVRSRLQHAGIRSGWAMPE
jgi:hypothetical protein